MNRTVGDASRALARQGFDCIGSSCLPLPHRSISVSAAGVPATSHVVIWCAESAVPDRPAGRSARGTAAGVLSEGSMPPCPGFDPAKLLCWQYSGYSTRQGWSSGLAEMCNATTAWADPCADNTPLLACARYNTRDRDVAYKHYQHNAQVPARLHRWSWHV